MGGIFYGDPGGGLLGQLQRNEYLRYSRDIARRLDRVMVLTGTASAISVLALRDVAAARGTVLPGTRGQVYDTLALTEDNELTLALKTLGWKLTYPSTCRVTNGDHAQLARPVAAAYALAARRTGQPAPLRAHRHHPALLGDTRLTAGQRPIAVNNPAAAGN
ncbi:hypothetical protein [Streptomyces aurantiogriseus]|uniref:Uncharacterized protein n=1 Tax=Streptomyces aurantiogriseus TaxID=66870 RepID=A0A918FJD9_9ACTN|nr:hypothetical protein [Streptomyces aurantiogriseus]GGR41976.1 hypothetical protein GCM10010251_68600 [Streptomyces aurantiogriseus]